MQLQGRGVHVILGSHLQWVIVAFTLIPAYTTVVQNMGVTSSHYSPIECSTMCSIFSLKNMSTTLHSSVRIGIKQLFSGGSEHEATSLLGRCDCFPVGGDFGLFFLQLY